MDSVGAGELLLATSEGAEVVPGADGEGDGLLPTWDGDEAGAEELLPTWDGDEGAGEVAGTVGTTGTVEFMGTPGADPDGLGNEGTVLD